jgi:ribonuclease HI
MEHIRILSIELNGTKKVKINWLKTHVTKNLTLQVDNEVRRAMEQMEALRLRQNHRHEDNYQNQAKGIQRH